MLTALTAIISALNPIERITKAIVDAKIATTNATTERDRIEADERVKNLEARRDVMIAEAKITRANVIMRVFLALPVAIVLWKVLVYDKALGQWTGGRTDALDANLWGVITAVIGFYFLYEGAIGIVRTIKR